MTIPTSDSSLLGSDDAITTPFAPKPSAGVQPAMPPPAPRAATELEARIHARRSELIAQLVALKADTGKEAATTRAAIKAKLSELGHIIKKDVVDGWANLGSTVKFELDRWLTS
jgi:hypothetical protein